MPGQRYTSNRRRNVGEGTGGGRAVQVTGSRTARRASESPGRLAYTGENAVICPSCGVGLDPDRGGAGPGLVPKHARFGHVTSVMGQAPCRGYVDSLGGGEE